MTIKPLGDRVLIEPIEAVPVSEVIIIPDKAKAKPTRGKIVALGTGATDKHGQYVPFDVALDDIVFFNQYGGTDVTIGAKRYLLCRIEEIKAVVG